MTGEPSAATRAPPADGALTNGSGRLLLLLDRVAHQFQAVVAEIHVVLVDEHGRRAEAAAGDQLVRGVEELLLPVGSGDLLEEVARVHADAFDDLTQHVVLRDVLVVGPVGLEHLPRIIGDLARLDRDEGAAQRLDRVHREYRGLADGEPLKARPVVHVLAVIGVLGRHRVLAPLIDARVHLVEHAADQKRLPDELGTRLRADLLDPVEGQIGPGAGVVEEELYRCHDCGRSRFALRWAKGSRSAVPVPDRCLTGGPCTGSSATKPFARREEEECRNRPPTSAPTRRCARGTSSPSTDSSSTVNISTDCTASATSRGASTAIGPTPPSSRAIRSR